MALNLQVFCFHITYCIQLLNQVLCSKNLEKNYKLSSKKFMFNVKRIDIFV